MNSPKVIYPTLICFVLGWWYLAFYNPTTSLQETLETLFEKPITYPAKLSELKSEDLRRALGGDLALMTTLMASWDIDAQLLLKAGHDAQRLTEEEFLSAQTLGRLTPQELETFNTSVRLPWIQDDLGQIHILQKPYSTVFPQTYMSADFLIAMLKPAQIRAIPKGLREQKSLYSPELLEQFPHNIDSYHTKLLYQNPPDIAFVAHFSNPNAIQTLKDQGIPLATFKYMNTVDDIYNVLQRTGHLVNCPMQARLLEIFMRAAFMHMNNRLAALALAQQKILYVRYDGRYSVPQNTTLPGQLLAPLGINLFFDQRLQKSSATQWSTPLSFEELTTLNPNILIISTMPGLTLQDLLYHQPAITFLDCFQQQHIFFVDESIQDSTSQYVVLAYYDLFKTLELAYKK